MCSANATPLTAESDSPPLTVGVFDSGVGGLSVLRALHMRLPHANVIYVADSAHAPYGERDDVYVQDRSHRIAAHLLDASGCQGLVIACNTATAAAASSLRTRWPGVPMVGVEPGVKPAAASSRNKRIGVMATSGTLRSQRFRDLIATHASDALVIPQPCPGLALAIEQGDLDSDAVGALLTSYCQPLKEHDVDTVVLGCTHYAFVHQKIQHLLGPEVTLVDTAEAVALQAARLLAPGSGFAQTETRSSGHIELLTTGDAHHLDLIAQRWLPFPVTTRHLAL